MKLQNSAGVSQSHSLPQVNAETKKSDNHSKPPIVDSTSATKFGLDPNTVLEEETDSEDENSETDASDSGDSEEMKLKVSLLSRNGKSRFNSRKKRKNQTGKDGFVNLDITDKAYGLIQFVLSLGIATEQYQLAPRSLFICI